MTKTDSGTLHEFVLHYGWSEGITSLREIAADERCGEATTLMIFRRVRPEEYTRYARRARKIEGGIVRFERHDVWLLTGIPAQEAGGRCAGAGR